MNSIPLLQQSPEAIIFDLDNTLYDYTKPHLAGLEAAFLEWRKTTAHPPTTFSAFQSRYKTHRDHFHQTLGHAPSSHNRLLGFISLCESLHARTPLSGSPYTFAEHLENAYWQSYRSVMTLHPGVRELFELLQHNNVKVGILSDGLAHLQFAKLRALGLLEKVNAVVTSEEVGTEKPSPEGLFLLFQKLGISRAAQPFNYWMVGDNRERDIELALQNRLVPILIQESLPPQFEQAAADQTDSSCVVASFHDLYTAIRGGRIDGGR